MNMFRSFMAFAAMVITSVLLSSGCSASKPTASSASGSSQSFPVVDQGGKIAIAAHRGFWDCSEAGKSQNSIASLAQAQQHGLWGSECDLHLTSDGVVIVNHDKDIDGLKIAENTYATLSTHLLKNGEKRPTLDEYLDQAAKHSDKTVLVIELKKQPTKEAETQLVEKTLKTLKAHRMYDPSKVMFISFSFYMCKMIADRCPEFVNQYLNGDLAPVVLAREGINGIDYEIQVLKDHKYWVRQAHDLGMSVNVWTVNSSRDMEFFIELGVDAITTNDPLKLRKLLKDKEYAK